jgi:hypothetical protein
LQESSLGSSEVESPLQGDGGAAGDDPDGAWDDPELWDVVPPISARAVLTSLFAASAAETSAA